MSVARYLSVALAAWIHVVRAGSFEDYALDDDNDDGRGYRNLFTSGGIYYLKVNSTNMFATGLVLSTLTFAGVVLFTFSPLLSAKPRTKSKTTSDSNTNSTNSTNSTSSTNRLDQLYELYHVSQENNAYGYRNKNSRRIQRSTDAGMK